MTNETHEKEIMQIEHARVQTLLAEAIGQIETEGGSIRFFNASFMAAAMALHANVEGIEAVEGSLAKHASKLIEANAAGRA